MCIDEAPMVAIRMLDPVSVPRPALVELQQLPTRTNALNMRMNAADANSERPAPATRRAQG
jgi:hypothetical protein